MGHDGAALSQGALTDFNLSHGVGWERGTPLLLPVESSYLDWHESGKQLDVNWMSVCGGYLLSLPDESLITLNGINIQTACVKAKSGPC